MQSDLGHIIVAALAVALPVGITLSCSKRNTRARKSEKWLLLELGGTSGRVALANKTNGVLSIQLRFELPTTGGPQTFFKQVLRRVSDYSKVDKIGVASFGPAVVDPNSEQYGSLANLPAMKRSWQFYSIKQALSVLLPKDSPCFYFDTDVNAPALAEFRLGGHRATNSLAYITVGTGIGVGLVCGGKTVKGFSHPEGGHVTVSRAKGDQSFQGVCIYHKDCVQGLASSHAIAKRVGRKVEQLGSVSEQDAVWGLVGEYLGQLCLSIFYIANPQVIVIGGGVFSRKSLYPATREAFARANNKYVQHSRLDKPDSIDTFIVPPSLGADSALLGASMLDGL